MARGLRLFLVALFALIPAIACGGPEEDIGTVMNDWAKAFNSNDVEPLVNLYASDAVVIGTAQPKLLEGKQAVHSYFSRLAKSADTVTIDRIKIVSVREDVAYATGFYTFSGTVKCGKLKRASQWCS